MSYVVIKEFVDLKDHNHSYNIGDEYPREGTRFPKERIDELMSSKNRRGTPLIELRRAQEAVSFDKEEPREPGADVSEDSIAKPKRKPRKK